MNYNKITMNNNIELLHNFIKNTNEPSFRYFINRSIDCIKNHIVTIVLTENENIIGYGHIDYDDNKYWLGICINNKFQSNGYGNKLINYLLLQIRDKNINKIYLAVDIDNYKAINLYNKYKFKIQKYENNHYIMIKIFEKENDISLPVSNGEALDKLTILDIKKSKIIDNRKEDVIKEYNILKNNLYQTIINNKYYYDILKYINLQIWEMQDNFRYNNCNKTQICMDIIELNDSRFRVKKKINDNDNSFLKEQKGYNKKKAFLLQHLGMGDHITCIGMTRYLSTKYDEILLVCKENNLKNLVEIYSNDKSINFYTVISDKDISPNYGFNINKFKEITNGYDIFLCGYHNFNKKPSFNNLPFCFYEQLNINPEYLWRYFNVPDTHNSTELYNMTQNNNIIFVHNNSSSGNVFNVIDVFNKLNINYEKFLIVNPCSNFYNTVDDINKYNLCEKIRNYSILSYKKIIENADYIFVSDSSFFCLIFNLQLKTNNNYLIKRNNNSYTDYNIIWSEKYNYEIYNKKKFKQLTI